MSGVVNTFWKGASKIWNPIVGDHVKEVHMSEDLFHNSPQSAPKAMRRAIEEANRKRAAPTLDDARASQIENDRIRRRKGVLADIYAGTSTTSPSVAVKTLLGS